jgi:YD repeat-containing protein
VKTIVDPDNVTTSLLHDFAGRRTQITRNSRIWSYGYDKNGNMISETTPCTGPTCQAAYTTTIGYDNLDRPINRAIAPRTMSVADRDLFGAFDVSDYDGGPNLVGRLRVWQTFDTTNASPFLFRRDVGYDGQGNQYLAIDQVDFADYNLSRSSSAEFNLAGDPYRKSYEDALGLGGCSSTTSEQLFDNRGLPSEVTIKQCPSSGSGPSSSIRNTRNVAGLVTRRESCSARQQSKQNVENRLKRIKSSADLDTDDMDDDKIE